MDAALGLGATLDADTAALRRATVARCAASLRRVRVVGRNMPRLNDVELHHETYAGGRAATNLPARRAGCAERWRLRRPSDRAGQAPARKVSCPRLPTSSIRLVSRARQGLAARGAEMVQGRQV